MRVAVALGVLVGGWCLGIHGRQDTVGGVAVEAASVGRLEVLVFWIEKFMNGMYDGRDGLHVWAYMGNRHSGRCRC